MRKLVKAVVWGAGLFCAGLAGVVGFGLWEARKVSDAELAADLGDGPDL